MAWTKAKIVIGAVTGLILATSVSVVVVRQASLVHGKTEDQWIKSIKYSFDLNEAQLSAQTRSWRVLGPKGIRMLVRALKSPAYDHPTRMCVADLLRELGNDAKAAIPDIISQINVEKDGGVLAIELVYVNGRINTMPAKDKAALFRGLIRALQNEDVSARNNALGALQYYPDQTDTTVPLMVSALQDASPLVRVAAVRALDSVDPQNAIRTNFVPVLAWCVTNPPGITPSAPNEAVIMLGDMHRDPQVAVPALIHALQSDESYVRGNAAAALGKFGSQGKAAVTALTKALNDSDADVRRQADGALKRINSGAPPK